MKRTVLLVDLDGTLTDPAEGIVGSFRDALKAMGRPAPTRGGPDMDHWHAAEALVRPTSSADRRRLGPGPSCRLRPDRERRDREPHAPRRARERADVEKAHDNAGPGGDRGPREDRDKADAVDGRGAGRWCCVFAAHAGSRYPIRARFRHSPTLEPRNWSPSLPFKVAPMNGREARESGLG